ncbi:GH20504 [Drosophila grimshawi]|uniref:GH20504 n=1 Tax=Drosophila grimshawi TaxID=7222 RepID=B4J8Z6_DROGR|nr:GH20504 [Drosophila grimshawi]
MQSTFKLKYICLLWLTLLQVQAQDIVPNFPEDFDTTTIPTIGTTSGPATELPATTTTSEPAVEPSTDTPSTTTTTTIATTTEAEATTELPLTTTPATTTTEAVASTTPRLPLYPTYPPGPIPTRPPVLPPYSTTTSNSISWDNSDESEEQLCYLHGKDDYRRLQWRHGIQAQDIVPDFPEDFDTTTIPTIGTTSGPATELPATTTTSEPAVEPTTDAPSTTTTTQIVTTTEAEATIELPLTTTPATTTTEAVASTTPRLPLYPTYPPGPIPTRSPVVPPYSTTTSKSISWDDSDESEEQLCYLRVKYKRRVVRFSGSE